MTAVTIPIGPVAIQSYLDMDIITFTELATYKGEFVAEMINCILEYGEHPFDLTWFEFLIIY